MRIIDWFKEIFAPKKSLAPPQPRKRPAAKKTTTRKKTK